MILWERTAYSAASHYWSIQCTYSQSISCNISTAHLSIYLTSESINILQESRKHSWHWSHRTLPVHTGSLIIELKKAGNVLHKLWMAMETSNPIQSHIDRKWFRSVAVTQAIKVPDSWPPWIRVTYFHRKKPTLKAKKEKPRIVQGTFSLSEASMMWLSPYLSVSVQRVSHMLDWRAWYPRIRK